MLEVLRDVFSESYVRINSDVVGGGWLVGGVWRLAGILLNHRLWSPGVEVWCDHRDISPQYPASQMTQRQIKLIIIFLAESLTPVLASQALCELDESGEGRVRGSIRLEGDSRATQYVVTNTRLERFLSAHYSVLA